ncbi:MAG: hypothetical protein GC159_15800 [Phycisphaera sp.]|nr:hypothetical protein [Phycisphaera sp.]
MGFLNPFILLGLALASVPIIIHLLYRRRFLRVDWAPMKYLKLTMRSNRRRLRLEQLLLLLLRTMIIVMLVMAVARPTVQATGAGSWLAGGNRVSRIVVIDDSLSMGYQADGPPAFKRAVEATQTLVATLGSQDSVTLLRTSAPADPLVRDVHLDDDKPLLDALGSLKVSHTASDWPRTLKALDPYLDSATFPIREITIVTDLRKHGWNAEVTELAKAWADDRVAVRIVNVGASETDNVSLDAMDQETPIALVGAPVTLRIKVRNHTAATISDAQATLTVDEQTNTLKLPDLPAGEVTEVTHSITLREPGQHRVRLDLSKDRLDEDNTRWLTIDVRDKLSIMLVDGEPSAEPFQSETDFLLLAFSVGRVPWHVTRVIDAEWMANTYEAPDVLVLANVADAGTRRKQLEKLVREGTGLMVFPGPLVDPESYNRSMVAGETELLPGTLGQTIDEPVTGVVVEALPDSPLTLLADVAPEALARVQTKRVLDVKVPDDQNQTVRVLARWNDPQQRPAILERRVGRGKVLMWTVTADKQWSDWPIDPTYVLAVREAALSIARRSEHVAGVVAGQPLSLTVSSDETPTRPTVTTPDGDAPVPVTVEGTQLRHADTARAGIYAMNWQTPTGADAVRLFHVNPDKAESDLEPIDRNELLGLFAPVDVGIVDYTGTAVSLSGQGKEIWRTLAMALMTMVMVETVFAWWVGRER